MPCADRKVVRYIFALVSCAGYGVRCFGQHATAAASMAPHYDEDEARLFLGYARMSFCTRRHIEQWDCGAMCKAAPAFSGHVRYLGRGSEWEEQGFVARVQSLPPARHMRAVAAQAEAESNCVVAFRGSVEFMNWVNDGEFWKTAWPDWSQDRGASWCRGCGVHHGFSEAYRELRQPMFAAIQELGCTRIGFAGHSAGASLVTLASFEVRARLGIRADPVWTFGKPRVGDLAFVKAYIAAAKSQDVEPPLWRVVHYHDPVPRLPPVSPLGYVHEPMEVYYKDRASSQFHVCPSSSDYPENHEKDCAWRTDIIDCVGHPLYDHTTYLNVSTISDTFPDSCMKDKLSALPWRGLAAATQGPAAERRQLMV